MRKFHFAFVCLLTAIFCFSAFAQNYSIERYLNIRSASSPTFSPDAKKIAFLTNITGTNQIWFVDADGGFPEQITAYEDNISFVEWSPSGNGLIFGKAIGGNENAQIFWLSNDGANVEQLTNNEKVRHNFGSFSKDGKRIFYSSNKRNANYFDVYEINIETGAEKLIYKDDSANYVADVSDDNSKLIISRSSVRFSGDNDLYFVDIKSGKAEHLTPHKEAATFSDVHFLPGGDSIIFGTNKDTEFITLSKMDLRTKKIISYDADNADLDATAISKDGNVFANSSNTEGFSGLYLRGLFTNENSRNVQKSKANLTQIVPVKLPAKGVISSLEFSPDGKKLTFVFNSPQHPLDIWIYDLRDEKLTQVTKSSVSGIPRESFIEPELIKYKSFDGREISAWYYMPNSPVKMINPSKVSEKTKNKNQPSKVNSNDNNIDTIVKVAERGRQQISFNGRSENFINGTFINGNIPVILSVHGGPEAQSRRSFSALNQYYLSRGYAILETNVRGSSGYGKTFSHLDDIEKREDSVKDLAYAVEWLKKDGNANPNKIAIMGGSYGGYMTLAAITLYPDLFAAAVDTVGIANWETFLKNTSGYRRTQREVEYGFLDKNLDFLKSVSPIYKADKIKTPLFIIHGKNDPRVPYTEAEQLVEKLKNRGVSVEYKLFDDEGHGISKLKNRLELYLQVADFLDKHLK